MPMSIYGRDTLVSAPRPKLLSLTGVAPNPGALAGQLYRPEGLAENAPLIVVLHGCTQKGLSYARNAGWLGLADRHGFAVLVPQQQRSNNGNLCFNWFERGDTVRGGGEAASIIAMVEQSITACQSDTAQIFVTGLSAGAAMGGVLLAAYPDMFAGGGLIAGLPYGVASSMMSALQQMRTGPHDSPVILAERVRNASDHAGPWPRVSIWHGSADRTVSCENGKAIVQQWLAIHGVRANVPATLNAAGKHRQQWQNSAGTVCVEYIEVPGMSHGTPIDSRNTAETAAPFILDVGMSSSEALIDFWGIERSDHEHDTLSPSVTDTDITQIAAFETGTSALSDFGKSDPSIENIINDALRKAGLLPQL